MFSTSAVKLLKEMSGEIKKSKTAYFVKNQQEAKVEFHRRRYFSHPMDSVVFQAKLDQSVKDAKDKTLAKQAAIADNSTGQNAFHWVLSNQVFKVPSPTTDDNQIVDYAYMCTDLVLQKEVRYFTQHPEIYFGSSEGFAEDQGFDWIRREVTKQFYSGKNLQSCRQEILDAHTRLVEQKKVAMVKDRIADQSYQIMSILLEPFKQDRNKLLAALRVKDQQGRTPLHCYFESPAKFIKINPELLLPELLLERDAKGRNLMHLMGKNCPLPVEVCEKIGITAFKTALSQVDNDLNTPLHDACRFNDSINVKTICKLLTMEVNSAELKTSALNTMQHDKLFQRNKEGLNPLHLVFANEDSNRDEDGRKILVLHLIAGNELFAAKAKEQDKKGCTALHRAVQMGNVKGAIALFHCLSSTPQEKTNLILVKNHRGKTALEEACASGDYRLITLMLEEMDAFELQRLEKEANLSVLIKQNQNINDQGIQELINKINANPFIVALCFCIRYFNHEDFERYGRDFAAVFESFAKYQKIPEQNYACFKRELGKEYQVVRNNLSHVRTEQVEECKKYLVKLQESKNSQDSNCAAQLLQWMPSFKALKAQNDKSECQSVQTQVQKGNLEIEIEQETRFERWFS